MALFAALLFAPAMDVLSASPPSDHKESTACSNEAVDRTTGNALQSDTNSATTILRDMPDKHRRSQSVAPASGGPPPEMSLLYPQDRAVGSYNPYRTERGATEGWR